MGRMLHSRWSCTEMVDVASTTMRESLVKEIVDNERKISLIVDESTSAGLVFDKSAGSLCIDKWITREYVFEYDLAPGTRCRQCNLCYSKSP